MPKLAKDAIPNELLRYERERRNWKQEEVVQQEDRVNLNPLPPRQWRKKTRKKPPTEEVDPKMVGRWERGTLTPTRHYRRQLAALFGRSERELGYPKEGIPFWDVKYKQNELFTGREDILLQLSNFPHLRNEHNKHKVENEPPLKQRPQVLTGVGGIGKTQIAIAYIYRYQHEYHTIIMLNASSLAELTSEFARVAEVLRLVEEQDMNDQRKKIAEVQAWLASQYLTRWLLIIDNVDSPEIVHGVMSLLPQNYYGHLLLLSRLDDPGAEVYGLQQIRITSMPEEEGATFLLRRAGILDVQASTTQATRDDQQQALELSNNLDGLPLALDQAGAYIREIPTTLHDYASLYETRRAEFLRHRGNYGLSHPESVVVTWLLNFEQIGADAQELLRLFAYLAPDDIPEELVAVDTGTPGTILAAVASDKERLRKAVKNLRRYSLISRHTGERTYTIHRLVQAVTQDEMDEKMQLLWGKQAIYMVHRLYVDTDLQWKDTSEWWRRYERFLPHAQMCLARAMKDEKGRLSIVAMELLSSSIAYYLYQCGRYEEAYTFYRYAEVYQRAVLGVEHLQTIRAQNNLGVLCTMQGRYGDQKWRDAARHELTDASAASFGRHEFEYSVITNNLGVLRHFEEAYRDAETCYKIALAKMKELNVEHHWLSSVQVNLAQLYREQGRHEEARALSQQTGRPDVLDDTIEETVQIAKSYLTGGPDFLGMEQSTQFPSLPPLKDFLDEKWAQAVSDTGISPTEISSMMDTFAQTYKVYSAEGSENALAFFRDAVKPLNWWREEDDILIKELLPLQMQILETVFRFEGPQFDDTRETDISSDEVGESFLNVFQQLRSIPSKAKALFPIWLSDLDLTDITDKPNQEGLGEEFSQKIIDSVLNSTSISEPASETEEQIQEPRAVVKNNIHESTGSSLSLGVTTQWDKIKATHPELDLSTLEKQIDYFCKQNAKVLVNAYNRCDEAGKAKRKAAFSLLGLSELTNEEALKDQLLAFWWEYSGKRKRFEYENVARAIVEGSRRNGAIDYELLEEHLRELSQLLNAFGSGGHVIIRDHIKAYASRLSHGDDYIFHQNAC